MSDLWIISIVLICLFLTNNSVLVLSFVPTTTLSYMVPPAFAVSTQLQFSDDKNTNNGISNINVTLEFTSRVGDIFPDGEILTIEMVDHQPLGCTVEESINEEDDYLFISKLADKGSAENAGFQVGDVVVQITGTFGKLTDVLGASVEKIKRLVSAVPVEDPLTIQVVRGTNILERHESAIVDLCNFSGENDNDVEDCVVDFIAGGYDYSIVDDKEPNCDSDDEDAECLIDGMYNMWAEELPPPSTTSDSTDEINDETTAPKPWSSRYNDQTDDKISEKAPPKPWSSRSSGSGTWVLDPKTRKMINIDK